MRFCELVKARRAERGLSQEALAALLGVSRQTVIAIERGQAPATATLSALVNVLELDLPSAELFASMAPEEEGVDDTGPQPCTCGRLVAKTGTEGA